LRAVTRTKRDESSRFIPNKVLDSFPNRGASSSEPVASRRYSNEETKEHLEEEVGVIVPLVHPGKFLNELVLDE